MLHHGKVFKLKTSEMLSIFIFGDLQFRRNDDAFDSSAWEQFRDEFKSTPNAWALGLGDYEDFLRPTMRARIQASVAGDDSARQQIDDRVRSEQEAIIKEMSFLEGRLIGLHSGHHEWEFSTGDNSTQRLCQALKSPYLGWMASTRVGIGEEWSNSTFTYTIISMHGTGSALATTTDARWLESRIVPAFEADHYIRGHSCKSVAWTAFERHSIRRAGPFGDIVKPVRCINVGGFNKGYTDGWKSSYVERAGLTPQAVGWAVIRIKRVFPKSKIDHKDGLAHRSGTLQIDHLTRHPTIPQNTHTR